ncbi:hypothetical protein K435DRAFT_800977 [Dendrothele bispora CBS 962.96]|uniref:SMP domain-containing protein n=1 Tax=Dendrothele bispora (strain CBS 962.96) TaxID=1314807 RepID=A0A4S8LQV3_DENBC|nr:hypothetical protein K435DRAFT_800977 [Dendrothele bispora CBS 962.96]
MMNPAPKPEKPKPKQQTSTTSKQISKAAISTVTRTQTASFMQGASQIAADGIDQQYIKGNDIIVGALSRPKGDPNFFKDAEKLMKNMAESSPKPSNAVNQQPAQSQASNTFFQNASQTVLREASVRFVQGDQANMPTDVSPELAKVIMAGLAKPEPNEKTKPPRSERSRDDSHWTY